jgi:hypothetical protein
MYTYIFTMFIVQASQMSMELLSTWCLAAAFFLVSDAVLSQEVADGKIKVQSACAAFYFITNESSMMWYCAISRQVIRHLNYYSIWCSIIKTWYEWDFLCLCMYMGWATKTSPSTATFEECSRRICWCSAAVIVVWLAELLSQGFTKE